MPRAEIDDTYAEAFRSIYAEVLITARDRAWLDHAVHAATGNASSHHPVRLRGRARPLRRPRRRRYSHARRPARGRRAVPRAALPQGPRRGPRTRRAGAASARTC